MVNVKKMKKLTRSQERELALHYLYAIEGQQKLQEDIDWEIINIENMPEVFSDRTSRDMYHMDIISGVLKELEVIDDKIEEHLIDWRMERLALIDKNILRIAIYEILFNDDIPKAVAINEAVELAKKYSDHDSPGFVNGILGQIG